MSNDTTALQLVDGDHIRGNDNTSKTILVYGDYECPLTRALELSLARLRHSDPDSFRTVFRFFPLREIHFYAQSAAEAAEAVYAAGGPDAFWFMHDGLFAHQNQLDVSGLERRAEEARVQASTVRDALRTHRFARRVERDVESGRANDVEGTPTVFIDGERYHGHWDVSSLREAMKLSSR